jgi:hypothetical protein
MTGKIDVTILHATAALTGPAAGARLPGDEKLLTPPLGPVEIVFLCGRCHRDPPWSVVPMTPYLRGQRADRFADWEVFLREHGHSENRKKTGRRSEPIGR